MISESKSTCPKCGGQLKYYDTVKRIVRTKYGVKNKVDIRRFRCQKCSAMHRHCWNDYHYSHGGEGNAKSADSYRGEKRRT